MNKKNQNSSRNTTGMIPSYILSCEKGKEIAKLKGMEKGWLYPTFLINFIRKPALLLLFDKIYIDPNAALKAKNFITDKVQHIKSLDGNSENQIKCSSGSHYEYSNIDKELSPQDNAQAEILLNDLKTMEKLLDSDIFINRITEDELTWSDVEKIKEGFNKDHHNSDFRKAVERLEDIYGYNYAAPNPTDFEAMNINIIEVIANKYKSVPLDDCARAPLYRYKLISIFEKYERTANQYVDNLPKIIFGLPDIKIKNIEEFLEIHQHKYVKDFREHIRYIADKTSDGVFSNRAREDLYRANKQLQELKIDTFTFVGSVLGVAGSSVAMALSITNPWAFTGSYLAFASSLNGTLEQLISLWERKEYHWFEFLKGFAESQAWENK